ncbi:MAG: OmpA/MotB family protein [Desulfuromonadaceae bacterium]
MQKMSLLLSLVALLVSGCTTPTSFLSIGNECRKIHEELLQCEEKTLELQTVVEDVERKAVDVADRTAQLEKDNAFLYRKVEDLNRTIRRQKSVISLQKTVIRLFDDSNLSMQKNIEEQIAAQKNSITPRRESDRWVFTNDSLFVGETTSLSASGKEKLRKVIHELGQRDDILLRVEGHADDRPLKETASYANNWDLSALRAAAVVAFLQRAGDVPPERLSAAGYGYYQPVASNVSPAGRRQNSRVEIIVEQSE